jgi:hypothetical protein
MAALAPHAESLIDVGSSGCPYLDWYGWIPHRTSLDLRTPYLSADINSIKADFLLWEKDRNYDVGTCLQVLEHIDRADLFARKLLDTSGILIVSVPYKWKAKTGNSHVHDPIDEAKMRDWFQRDPNYSIVIQEVTTAARRLVNVYERGSTRAWKSLRQRSSVD